MAEPETLEEIAGEVRGCQLCRLHQGRTLAVPGEGSTSSGIFLIGEAPGVEEDRRGEPFVGRAGRILDQALRDAGLERSSIFITNVVKCRPPGNRSPRADEMRACRPYLMRQIGLTGPSVIVTLGGVSTRSVLGLKGLLKDYLGRRELFQGIPVLPTYHPAARQPSVREFLVEALRKAKDIAEGT